MGAMPKDLLPSIQSKDYRNEVKGYEGAFFYSDKNFLMRKENIIPVKRCKIWHTCTAALNVAKFDDVISFKTIYKSPPTPLPPLSPPPLPHEML